MSALIGQTLADRYHVDLFLGKGGMAEVYKVWDSQRAVPLAMKLLRDDLAEDKVFLRRFQREAQTLGRLQHPHIVRFYGLEQVDDLAFMLMDFVDGTTLRKEIFHAKQPFTHQRILQITRPVCSALHYSHQMGMIHCDVKPANIMIHNNSTVLVTDFGIARMTEGATTTMVGAGTPAYMAPEQVRGEDPIPQTDIYALGVVLYEMVTGGERPFTGENAQTTGSTSEKVRWEQMHLAPPPPQQFNPGISPEMGGIIVKCLEKDPARRYDNALGLLNALEQALSVGGITPPRVNEPILVKPAESAPANKPSPVQQAPVSPVFAQPQYTPAGSLPAATRERKRLLSGLIFGGVGGAILCGLIVLGAVLLGRDRLTSLLASSRPTSTRIVERVALPTITPTAIALSTLAPTEPPIISPENLATPTLALAQRVPPTSAISSTPEGNLYTNETLGFTIQYPSSWLSTSMGDWGIAFAPSLEVLNSSSGFPNGMAFIVLRQTVTEAGMPGGVDPTSPESILNGLVSGQMPAEAQQLEKVQFFQFATYPAASTVVSMTDSATGNKYILYITIIISGETMTMVYAGCPEADWPAGRPIFEWMRSTLTLQALKQKPTETATLPPLAPTADRPMPTEAPPAPTATSPAPASSLSGILLARLENGVLTVSDLNQKSR